MLPQALLLDLDDTILADSTSAETCWVAVCDEFASRINGLDAALLLAAIREQRDWYWSDAERHRVGRLDLAAARRAIVAGALRTQGFDGPMLAGQIVEAYALRRDEDVQPFPGALDTLRRLREAGVRLALLTNGSAALQWRKIERHALANLFDCIVVEGEFGCGKPDPRVYRHALSRLEARPSETWMAGDNLEWDVAAPQRLGITGIWLDVAAAGLPPACPIQPDRIIRALTDLLPPTLE
jgi:putative hydrolase of the HAD superfamily